MNFNIVNMVAVSLGLFFCVGARADWVAVSEGDKAKSYVDSLDLSVSPRTDVVKVWVLADYYIGQSIISEEEFNCRSAESRIIRYRQFLVPMGRGPLYKAGPYNDLAWKKLVPESNGYQVFRVVCGVR